MNLEQDKALEKQLRQVRPVPPRQELIQEIDASLSAIQHRKRLSRITTFAAWGGMGIAASILIVFGLLLFNGQLGVEPSSNEPMAFEKEEGPQVENPAADTDSRENSFLPVLAENNLKNRVDEGIVFLRNGLTARRYRYEFVDRVVWKNPSDGAVVEMQIPRDEVVLIPVQTF